MCNLDMIQNEVVRQYLPPRIAWVRCDDCYKWRRIAAALADSIEETNCKWYTNNLFLIYYCRCYLCRNFKINFVSVHFFVFWSSCYIYIYISSELSNEYENGQKIIQLWIALCPIASCVLQFALSGALFILY